jgi:hypothetical protein
MATSNALDQVREIGNWSAHPIKEVNEAETIMDVTADDAAYTLQVVELLFSDVFVVPARVARTQQRIDGEHHKV